MSDAPSNWRTHALCLAALFAGVLIAFGDIVDPDRTAFFRDHLLVFKPRWWAITSALRTGHLPALTHATTNGVPIEHLLNGTYTPGIFVFLLGGFEAAYDAYVILHFMLLAAGVYVLATSLCARPPEALLAASIATLGGPVLSTENLVVMLVGLAYAPWVYWCLRRLLNDSAGPSLARVAALGAAVGFHVQGITPILLLLDVIALVVLVAHCRPTITPRLITAGVAAGVLGLGLGAIELMPALEILPQSRRGGGFPYHELSGWALNPAQAIEFIAPGFWAPPDIPFINAPTATGSATDLPYFISLYFGAALPLVAQAILRRKIPLWLIVCTAILVMIAAGRHTPVHRWVTYIPLLSSSRYAIKYLVIAWAAIAIAGAFALRSLDDDRNALVIGGFIHTGVVLSALVTTTYPEFQGFLETFLQGYGERNPFIGIAHADFPALATTAMQKRLGFALVAPGVLAATAALWPKLKGRGSWVVAFIVLLDLAFAGRFVLFGASTQAQALPAEAAEILTDDEHRFFPEVPPGRIPGVAHHAGNTYFEDVTRSHGRRSRNSYQIARRHFDLSVNGYGNVIHERLFQLTLRLPDAERYRMLARVGVEHLTTSSPNVDAPLLLRYAIPGEDDEHIYRLNNVRPYVSAYTRWRSAPSSINNRTARFLLTDEASRDIGVVFDNPTVASSTVTNCGAHAVQVRVIETDDPNLIAADIDAACPALIVALEVVITGWGVTVDGAPRPLLQADAGMLGVQVEPGKHRVEFRYQRLLDKWLPVSITSALMLLALGATALRRRSRVTRA